MNEHNSKEWIITIGLHKALTEQMQMLTGIESKRVKMYLNRDVNHFNITARKFEKMFTQEALDEVSDVIHDAINEVRKGIEVVK